MRARWIVGYMTWVGTVCIDIEYGIMIYIETLKISSSLIFMSSNHKLTTYNLIV